MESLISIAHASLIFWPGLLLGSVVFMAVGLNKKNKDMKNYGLAGIGISVGMIVLQISLTYFLISQI